MMMTLIEEKHRTWLKEHLNLTFEEVEAMSDEEDSKLCNALLMAECDALEDDTEDLGFEYRFIPWEEAEIAGDWKEAEDE